jgi:ABC-type multidrug transport system fused ATPase/permease subunit
LKSKKINKSSGVFEPLLFSMSYLGKKKKTIYLLILAAMITTATRLYVPVIIGNIVNAIQSGIYSELDYFIELILLMAVISSLATFVVNFGSQYSSQHYAYNLRKKVVDSLTMKEIPFFQGSTSGDLLSRTTMDVQATTNFLMNTLSMLIPTLMMIAFAFIYLLFLSYIYAIFFIATVPALISIGVIFQRKQRPHWRKIRGLYGEMNEKLQEDIAGQRTVRTYSLENEQIGKFMDVTGNYYGEYMDVAYLRGFYNNIMPFIISVAATGVIIYGGYVSVITGVEVGNLVAAVNIFNLVTMPVTSLGRLIVFSENARASIGRIKEVLDPSHNEDLHTRGTFPSENSIEFHDVSVTRGESEIIKGVSSKFSAGSFVCITGETGTGKSTLVNLIPALDKPTSGYVSIGGTNVRDIPLETLRRNVSIVPQEINILSGTISENITFGRPGINQAQVEKSARIAMLDDFIRTLPEKYDTMIGERGITLSGGQKQRLAIARALVTEPSVLILDDVTSSVDPETELNIFREIGKNITNITVVLVSLRYSALKYAMESYILVEGSLNRLEAEEAMSLFSVGDEQ